MRENKKIKLRKLNFYIIEENYIRYLSKFDMHIAYNKEQKRPYIGVVIVVKENYYFAPLFSPKQKHKTYKDNLTFFRIINKKNNSDLGIIRFSDMIPVPIECVHILETEGKSYGYKRLLSEQYSYINTHKNKAKILEKAEKLYDTVTKARKNKMTNFYRELSCNYKLLEEKSKEYKQKNIEDK